jgi:iron complex outermembrane receptor protein
MNRIAEADGQGTEINDRRTKLTGRAGALYLSENGLAPYISYSESFNPNSYADSAAIHCRQPTERNGKSA